jgi:hypothetical protein
LRKELDLGELARTQALRRSGRIAISAPEESRPHGVREFLAAVRGQAAVTVSGRPGATLDVALRIQFEIERALKRISQAGGPSRA